MIQTPVNQVRLTNVAVVRHKVGGQRFEIAWYKNKVQNYRDNVEHDLNEVLQIYEIFTNVSKGEVAKKKDIQEHLHANQDEAIKIILTKGQTQVSELERESEFETLKLQVANIVSTMCVNKDTSVPFPVPIILKAMDDIQFSLKENNSAKKQALMLIKELPKVLPLERAKMKIKFICNCKTKAEEMKETMQTEFEEDKSDEKLSILDKEQEIENSQVELVYLILPRLIRDLTKLCNKDDGVSIEIVEHYVYSRLVSEQEEEEAKKLYEETREKRLKEEAEEEKVGTQIIVSSNFEDSKATLQAEPGSQKEGEIKCTTCIDASFETKEEFKDHYKSEWHLENTKRKMNCNPKLSHKDYLLWKEDEIGTFLPNIVR